MSWDPTASQCKADVRTELREQQVEWLLFVAIYPVRVGNRETRGLDTNFADQLT